MNHVHTRCTTSEAKASKDKLHSVTVLHCCFKLGFLFIDIKKNFVENWNFLLIWTRAPYYWKWFWCCSPARALLQILASEINFTVFCQLHSCISCPIASSGVLDIECSECISIWSLNVECIATRDWELGRTAFSNQRHSRSCSMMTASYRKEEDQVHGYEGNREDLFILHIYRKCKKEEEKVDKYEKTCECWGAFFTIFSFCELGHNRIVAKRNKLQLIHAAGLFFSLGVWSYHLRTKVTNLKGRKLTLPLCICSSYVVLIIASDQPEGIGSISLQWADIFLPLTIHSNKM